MPYCAYIYPLDGRLQWFIRQKVLWAAIQDSRKIIQVFDIIVCGIFGTLHFADKANGNSQFESEVSLRNVFFYALLPYLIDSELINLTFHDRL